MLLELFQVGVGVGFACVVVVVGNAVAITCVHGWEQFSTRFRHGRNPAG